MKNIWNYLKGKKTYISCIVLAIYGVLKAFGWELTKDQDLAILVLIGAVFGASVRSSIK